MQVLVNQYRAYEVGTVVAGSEAHSEPATRGRRCPNPFIISITNQLHEFMKSCARTSHNRVTNLG